MSDGTVIALIAAIPPTLIALAAFIASVRNGSKLQDVHLSLNSRLTELVAASKAVGKQEEREDRKIAAGTQALATVAAQQTMTSVAVQAAQVALDAADKKVK